MTPARPPPPPPWHHEPAEVDRWLDGEGPPEERRARAADVEGDAALRARVAARRSFLTALACAGAEGLGGDALRLRALEARVRSSIVDKMAGGEVAEAAVPSRRGRVRGRAWIAAAAAVTGLAVWLGQGDQPAAAFDPVQRAADLLSWRPRNLEGVGTCAGGEREEVHSFALVREGAFEVTGCVPDAPGASVAVLRRPEQLPVVGYVAVPADGTTPAGEVGITEVEGGRILVFDVLDGGRRVYLAVDPQTLGPRAGGVGADGRVDSAWSCAACHGPVRQAQRNPHHIVLRRTP